MNGFVLPGNTFYISVNESFFRNRICITEAYSELFQTSNCYFRWRQNLKRTLVCLIPAIDKPKTLIINQQFKKSKLDIDTGGE